MYINLHDVMFKFCQLVDLVLQSKPFQWDIEHVALLHPVDFGDVTDKLKRQDRSVRLFHLFSLSNFSESLH